MTRLFIPRRIPSALAALTLTWAAASATAQVQYFDHVPTPEQVRSALGRPATSAPAGMRRKGIEWDTGNNSAQAIAALLPDTKRVSNPITEPGPGLAVPVAFERGTATVSKASLAYIEPIAAALREDMSLRLVIEGHADALGNPRTNAMLSWERAFSVFRVLVDRYGIDAQRLQPLGKGSSEPLRPDDPTHAANRRVQFRVTGTLPA